MKKNELLKAVAEKSNMTQTQVSDVINALQDVIIEECKCINGNVFLPKLGRFSNKISAQRQGYNPATKKKIIIPMTSTIKFKPLPSLKIKH